MDACPGPLCHADKTTWELIKTNEHTSRLAELIADDNDLIDILNSTTANHTFFALTKQALEGFPRGRNAPSPKFMSSLLRYHILPDRLSIQHIASHGTLATKLTERALESNLPQRIVVREHHDGVMLNRRSRVVGADMVGKSTSYHVYVRTNLTLENQKRHNPHNNQSPPSTPPRHAQCCTKHRPTSVPSRWP
ncbi:MAG: fasciclin domain-containing protein [Kocuria palustris]|nr:fasciclin domain-containing protein [Kocuria palustris]